MLMMDWFTAASSMKPSASRLRFKHGWQSAI
jgi:hypothetical protein